MRMVVTPVTGLAVRNRPLDGRGAAILRQQRCVQIEVAEPRQIDHPLRNDAAIADDDDRVWANDLQKGAEFLVVLDLVRAELTGRPRSSAESFTGDAANAIRGRWRGRVE